MARGCAKSCRESRSERMIARAPAHQGWSQTRRFRMAAPSSRPGGRRSGAARPLSTPGRPLLARKAKGRGELEPAGPRRSARRGASGQHPADRTKAENQPAGVAAPRRGVRLQPARDHWTQALSRLDHRMRAVSCRRQKGGDFRQFLHGRLVRNAKRRNEASIR